MATVLRKMKSCIDPLQDVTMPSDIFRGLFKKSEDLMEEPHETSARLSTHEAVCSLRYEGINSRLRRMESIGITSAGAIIALLVGIIMKVN